MFSADYCTNPDEYTVDRRCYVSEEQKNESPFNSVVKIEFGNIFKDEHCTGVIAKWNRNFTKDDLSVLNDLWYLFTAKHCTDADGDGIPDRELNIKLQNGNRFDVRLIGYGNRDARDKTNLYGDWVLYSIPSNFIIGLDGRYYVNMVSVENIKDKIDYVYADADAEKDGRSVMLVGYGILKIMSDTEIEEFKQRYINYLKKSGKTDIDENPEEYGFVEGGINIANDNAYKFKKKFLPYFYKQDVFYDQELKFSKCEFTEYPDCQIWGGDSGAPLFDSENRLVGLHSLGYRIVGGKYHGKNSGNVNTGYIYNRLNNARFSQ